jgi:hypothetical protein
MSSSRRSLGRLDLGEFRRELFHLYRAGRSRGVPDGWLVSIGHILQRALPKVVVGSEGGNLG